MDDRTRRYYEKHAHELAEQWKQSRGGVSRYFRTAFPTGSRILEIGCGTGRDLASLVREGYEPLGIEPLEPLERAGREHHPGIADRVRIGELPDDLPALADLGGPFDGILCAAVLHHIARPKLLRSVVAMRDMLASDGRVLLSIRQHPPAVDAHGRDADGRFDSGVRAGELQLLFERAGFETIGRWVDEDSLGRPERRWVTLLLQRQGAAAGQPLVQIEGVLSRDRKVATYKLALFRALTEIALAQTHRVRWLDDDQVAVPVEAIAERWILYYWPLFESAAFLPQMGGEWKGRRHRLGFARELEAVIAAYGQRGGLTEYAVQARTGAFPADDAKRIAALKKKLRTAIVQGPVKYAGGSLDGGRLFSHHRGSVLVAGALWRELSVMAYWIQDALVVRWAQLVRRLSKGEVEVDAVFPALLKVPEPAREVQAAREVYVQQGVRTCVWSGRGFRSRFDVDHIVPYALWHNNDLWNLVPAHPEVNRQKSDKLPALDLLVGRKPSIQACWNRLSEHLPDRFSREVDAFAGAGRAKNLDTLFDLVVESIEATALQRNAERFVV